MVFGWRKKKPAEIVKKLSKHLETLTKAPSSRQVEHAHASIIQTLQDLKALLVGSDGKSTSTSKRKKRKIEARPEDRQIIAEHVVNMNVFIVLITQMHKMPFETKKDIAFLFNFLFHHEKIFQEYVLGNPSIIWTIVSGYRPENKAVSMACGKMLEECIKNSKVCHLILTSNELWRFLDTYIVLKDFETQSSAFDVLKGLMTLHPSVSAEFFEQRYEKFFSSFNDLLRSDEYVVRRHATKVMCRTLTIPEHFDTMMRYVSSKSHLKIWMNLLRDDSDQVQLDAFHVFKLFVANPQMPKDVDHTLTTNGKRLISFLNRFHDKSHSVDEDFFAEKSMIIDHIKKMSSSPFGDLTGLHNNS